MYWKPPRSSRWQPAASPFHRLSSRPAQINLVTVSVDPRPALQTFYEVAGRVLLVQAETDTLALAVSKLFSGWFVDLLEIDGERAADAVITMRSGTSTIRPAPLLAPAFELAQDGMCYTDGTNFQLEFDGSRVSFSGTSHAVDIWVNENHAPDAAITRYVISQAFSAVLRRSGLFELHSGAVVAPGGSHAVLIAGSSGSGKSTLTWQLAASGWAYLSDDAVLLANADNGVECSALRRFFALRAQTIAAVGVPGEIQNSSGAEKKRFTPEQYFPERQVRCASPRSIFFPMITHELRTTVERLSAAETMTRLLRLCPWASYDKPVAGDYLGILAKLAKQSTSFELNAGTDLLGDDNRASEVLLAHAE